jgi:hypothetical protein
MRTVLISVILTLLLASSVTAAVMLEGRVVYNDEPLPGVRVFLYRTLDFDVDPLFISEATDAEGYYNVEVTPGSYALFARDAKRQLFAFCGRNPVRVKEGSVWAGLQAVPYAPAEVSAYDDDYSAAIEGTVLHAGQPLADAYVYLYLDAQEDLKGQGYRLSMPTGPDGRFAFDGLPESSYYLMVRKRMDGNRVGPVREDDYLGHFSGNPLIAKSGTVTSVVVSTVQKIKSASGSETFSQAEGPVLSGRVVDLQGNPVAGLHVFAYTDRVIGHKRPAALSTPTAEDGRFRLNLGQSGTYYVGARQDYGDSPAPGELFGMYDESSDHGLNVEPGQSIEDVEIVVEAINLQ